MTFAKDVVTGLHSGSFWGAPCFFKMFFCFRNMLVLFFVFVFVDFCWYFDGPS